jgi:4-coumarate--CoA ligase
MGDMTGVAEEDLHIFRSRFAKVPVPENITLPEFVLQDSHKYSEKVAIVESTTRKAYTYGDVMRDVRRFAKALRSIGLRKGNVVVVALPNLAIYPIVALGIMAAGGVFSSLNPLALESEIKKQVEDSEARLLVANEVAFDKVRNINNLATYMQKNYS